MFDRIRRLLNLPNSAQVETVAGVLADNGAPTPLPKIVARAALRYRSTDPRERHAEWVDFRAALRASGISNYTVDRVSAEVLEALDTRPKPQALNAPEGDRAIVADVMASYGVPHPDARHADRIAVAARRVVVLVTSEHPLEPGERAALEAAHSQLRTALMGAGWTRVGAAGPAASIVRRLREES